MKSDHDLRAVSAVLAAWQQIPANRRPITLIGPMGRLESVYKRRVDVVDERAAWRDITAAWQRLGLDGRATVALALNQLGPDDARAMSDDDLLALDRIGPGVLARVRAILEETGSEHG